MSLSKGEETEVKKDIEWAKKEIKELTTEESQNYPHDEMVEKEIVLGILNQLDEPEVLSDKWIDEHKYFANDKVGEDAVVKARDLRNLLMPKQEETRVLKEEIMSLKIVNEELENIVENKVVIERPTIPQFVANWIEDRRKSGLVNTDIIELIFGVDALSDLEVHVVDDPLKKYLNKGNEYKEKNS